MAKVQMKLTQEMLEANKTANARIINKGDYFIIGNKSAPTTARKKKVWFKNQNLSKMGTLRRRQSGAQKELYKVNAQKRGWTGTALLAQRSDIIVRKSAFGIGSAPVNKLYNGGGSPENDTNYDGIADYKCLYINNKYSDCQCIITQKHQDINDKLVRSGRRLNTWLQDEIIEFITAPIDFGLSAKVLSVPNQNLRAEISLEFWFENASAPISTSPKIVLSGASDWQKYSETMSEIPADFDFYLFKIDLIGKGEILFDNLKIEHSATNWAFDPTFDLFGSQPYGNFPEVEHDFRIQHDPTKTDILIDYVQNYVKI